MLVFNQQKKYKKLPAIIYEDLESLTKKVDACENNPEKSSTAKAAEHIPSGFSIYIISSFKRTKDKHGLY